MASLIVSFRASPARSCQGTVRHWHPQPPIAGRRNLVAKERRSRVATGPVLRAYIYRKREVSGATARAIETSEGQHDLTGAARRLVISTGGTGRNLRGRLARTVWPATEIVFFLQWTVCGAFPKDELLKPEARWIKALARVTQNAPIVLQIALNLCYKRQDEESYHVVNNRKSVYVGAS